MGKRARASRPLRESLRGRPWDSLLADIWLAELHADARMNNGAGRLMFVGRGWVTRGNRYWAGKVFAVLFFGVVNYLFALLPVMAVVSGVTRLPLWGVPLLLLWPAAWVVVGMVALRQLQCQGFVPPGTGGKAPFGWLKMTVLVSLLVACIPGLTVAGLLATLRRDFPGEQQARRVREAWLSRFAWSLPCVGLSANPDFFGGPLRVADVL